MMGRLSVTVILILGIVAVCRGAKKSNRHSRNLAPNFPDDLRFLLSNLKLVSEEQITGEDLTDLENPYATPPECDASSGFRTIDGTCNNLAKPFLGAAKTPLSRILPFNSYEDGIQEPTATGFASGNLFPPPRRVSLSVHQTTSNLSLVHSHLLMQYGQLLDHDITLSPEAGFEGGVEEEENRCCEFTPEELAAAEFPDILRECLNLDVSNDPIFLATCIPFLRSAVAPAFPDKVDPPMRFQLQDLTAFVDGSNVYGSTNRRAKSLRTFEDGKLKASIGPDGLEDLPADPANPSICFGESASDESGSASSISSVSSESSEEEEEEEEECLFTSGDIRNSEQAGLSSIHTLLLREHNRICDELKTFSSTSFTDETAYQTARKILGAIIQKITYGEWLPEVIGEDMMNKFGLNLMDSGRFEGYDPSVDPSILNEFSTAAFRFGHSLLRQTFGIDGEQIDITEFFGAFEVVKTHGTSAILNGLSDDQMEFRERFVTNGLRNTLFARELDLPAFNIQRSREHGIGSYNDVRRSFELDVFNEFGDLIGNTHLEEAIEPLEIYDEVGDIELFPGGLSEVPLKDAVVGETFAHIIAEQFKRLKVGDRFWFETNDPLTGFTDEQLAEIRKASFALLYCENVANPIVRENMLLVESPSNLPLDCSQLPRMDFSHW